VDGQTLDRDQATAAFEAIMTGQSEPTQTAALLSLIATRGPTVDEVTGAAAVMRAHVTTVNVPDGLTAIDTCGTGGDHAGTFNISTAAALVAAAAGRPQDVCVAKHGNRSVTSKSGSSQVLETLGVKLAVSPDTLTQCLDEAGICFCFAPRHHPAMKYAAPIRADLGFRTIFNILGPLTNPAGTSRQVIGVFHKDLCKMLGQVLANLGAEHAMVVHGLVPTGKGDHLTGLDELSTCGPSHACQVGDGDLTPIDIDAGELGLPISHPSALAADGPEQSAQIIRSVLAGKHGPARDIVLLNGAAALVVAGLAGDLSEGLGLAAEAVDDGRAGQTLETLARLTTADTSEG